MKLSKITDSRIFHHIKHHWLTIAFLLGFVTDSILLNRVDDKVDNAVLFLYVILATFSMVLFYVGAAGKASPRITTFLNKSMPIIMQYSFGGLLSGMLIFYGRSGDFIVSAPFLVLIMAVMAANELVTRRADRLLYNLVVYFIGVFSYLVLVVPVLIGEMGGLIFIISGLLALLVMVLVSKLLTKVIPNFMAIEKRKIVFSIGSLYILFNLFYYFNIIPPIPLSLTELSVYQNVERTSAGGYRITKTEYAWLQKFAPFSITFNPEPGLGAFCFARVYAPTSLKTDIVHHWEYKDKDGEWKSYYTNSYPISGKNKNGYRGFTQIENLKDGTWRCTVETTRGQVLGRRTFKVDSTALPKGLVTVVE